MARRARIRSRWLRIGGIAVAVAVVAVGWAVIRANSGPNPSAAAAVTAKDPVIL